MLEVPFPFYGEDIKITFDFDLYLNKMRLWNKMSPVATVQAKTLEFLHFDHARPSGSWRQWIASDPLLKEHYKIIYCVTN